MHFYPDTPLPPTESLCVTALSGSVLAGLGSEPPKGLQGFGEKGESWLSFVGFNGLLWNIVRLNQPNANLMPISQKHRASLVNSTISIKVPQISQKNVTFIKLGEPRPCPRSHRSPAYMPHVTRTHAFTAKPRSTTVFPMYVLRNIIQMA